MKRLLTQRAASWLWVLWVSLTPLAAWSAPAPQASGIPIAPAMSAAAPKVAERPNPSAPAILAWHRVGSPAPSTDPGIA